MPCIYALTDPREPEHIRYVGMSMGVKRPYSHVKIALTGKHSYLYNWVRLLLASDQEPFVSILEQLPEAVSRNELGEREKYHIADLRSKGHALTNGTEGGDGGACDEETRAKIRASMLGKKPSAETLAKRSAALRGLPKSAETRRLLSIALTGKRASQETRKLLSEVHTGKPLSSEHRARISEANKGKRVGGVTVQTPEARAKISAKLKGVPKSAETRAKMSLAQYRRHQC